MARQTEKIKKQNDIFCDLECGKFPRKNLFPALIGACGRFVLKYELNCEVLVSVGECDEEMAQYAQDNKCFAFLAQDTDFIIYKGAQYFLSMKDLDITTMKTYCYNRAALAESLSLDENHLPLFASLMGNDIVPFDMLKSFHEKLCLGSHNVIRKVHLVADYVRRFSSKGLIQEDLRKIAEYVFGDSEKSVHLENSIRMYDCKDIVNENVDWEVLSEARNRHKTCQMPPLIYPMMKGQPYELSVGLENFNDIMEAAAKVYRAMRQRLYRVLLHDNPARLDSVEEWCVEADEISETALSVTVQRVPDNLHPGLLILWTEDTDERRWKLVRWCISSALDDSAYKSIDERYFVLASALHYIVHKDIQLLFEWEVAAIISQAILLQTMQDSQLTNLRLPVPETRAVQVASLLGRGITTVLLVMAACGIPLKKMMPWRYYDGKLFLAEYISAKNRQRTNQMHEESDFQAIWQFVYGTRSCV